MFCLYQAVTSRWVLKLSQQPLKCCTLLAKKIQEQSLLLLLPISLPSQMVHNGGRGDSLACSGRALDETQGTLQDSLHSIHLGTEMALIPHGGAEFAKLTLEALGPNSCLCCYLRMVEVRKSLCCEALRQLTFDNDILHLVTQELVIDVARDGGFIHSKSLEGTLHPEEAQTRSSLKHLCNRLLKTERDAAFTHLSKEVDFHTKSTWKLWVTSTGAPTLLLSSIAISSP